jgi:hypothetical protein
MGSDQFAGALPQCVWNGADAKEMGPAQRRPARGALPMKKPATLVTKWLGYITVEAGCAACAGVVFWVKSLGHRRKDSAVSYRLASNGQPATDSMRSRETKHNFPRDFQRFPPQ